MTGEVKVYILKQFIQSCQLKVQDFETPDLLSRGLLRNPTALFLILITVYSDRDFIFLSTTEKLLSIRNK